MLLHLIGLITNLALAADDVHDVPVVDSDGKLVRVCARHDLLRARLALVDHERPEPGWLSRRTVGVGPSGRGGEPGPEAITG